MGAFLDEQDAPAQPRGRFLDEEPPAARPSIGQAILTGAKEAISPAGLLETAKSDFGPAIESFRNPSATTLTTLAAPGSVAGPAARWSACSW